MQIYLFLELFFNTVLELPAKNQARRNIDGIQTGNKIKLIKLSLLVDNMVFIIK